MSTRRDIADPSQRYVYYARPPRRTLRENVQRAIYNPDNHAILGRTLSRWASIILFYFIFLSVLGALFWLCMWVLVLSLSPHEPRYTLKDSVIGTNPGMGFRPMSDDIVKDGALISYDAKNESSVKVWTNRLDNFLEDYLNPKFKENIMICDHDKPRAPGKVCAVNMSNFGPCTKENGYSYNQSSPCVFVKLNKIYKWVPEVYNTTDDLPEDMDDELKATIANTPIEQRGQVWLSCEGETPKDRQNAGSIKYYPSKSWPAYGFDYRNIPGYLSPLVGVHFERPIISEVFAVRCRAWAKNIKARRQNYLEGSVRFELLIN